jgi:thiol:disulfide interchange protein DsbD
MKYKSFVIITLLFALWLQLPATAKKPEHFKAIAQPEKLSVKKGESFKIKLTLDFDKPWHTYSMKEQTGKDGIGPTATEISIGPKDAISLNGKIIAPKPHIEYDEGFGTKIEFFKDKFSFIIPVKANKNLSFDKDKITVNAFMQLCNSTNCLPPDDYSVQVSKDVADFSEAKDATAQDNTAVAESTQAKDTAAMQPSANPAQMQQNQQQAAPVQSESQKTIEKAKEQGFWSFIWLAMTYGALSILMPCVFPMIPITVSFFTKRTESKKSKGFRDALIYGLGIVGTFTLLGFIFALIFGATGIMDFAKNPWVYFVIALIFIFFAFNLFGAFEIQMPTGLMNKLNMKSQQSSGISSVLLMGLTFSLASFSCTGPFVAAVLSLASSGQWFYPIFGMLAYSAVLAAPFFLLALFPSAMKTMPRAGGWMNNIKGVMGFIVIATSMYFFSNAFVQWGWGVLTREIFLSVWVALMLLTTLYTLGVFKMSHDAPVDRVGTVRLIFAMIFATLTMFLLSGLFGHNLGELETFVPASTQTAMLVPGGASGSSAAIPAEQWIQDYKQAVAEAKKQNKNMFLDFSGVTCTNCKKMEKNMFPRPEVVALMNKMILVKMYTDRRTDADLANRQMQETKFGSIELPLYVILTPDEQLIATKTYTSDEGEFKTFLSQGVK